MIIIIITNCIQRKKNENKDMEKMKKKSYAKFKLIIKSKIFRILTGIFSNLNTLGNCLMINMILFY